MNNSLVLDRLGSVNRVLSGVFGKTEITPQEIVDAISDVKVRDGLLYAVSDFNYADESPAFVSELTDDAPTAQYELLRKLLATVNVVETDVDRVKLFAFISGLLLVTDNPDDARDFATLAMTIKTSSDEDTSEVGHLASLILSAFTRGIPPHEVANIFRQSLKVNTFDVCLSD